MTSPTVLDASAILAFLQGEPGADIVMSALASETCWVSAANQAEIISKALDHGLELPALHALLKELAYTVVDIKVEDGEAAGAMRTKTRPLGLSLGDRLCLALAQRLKARVLTADQPCLKVAKPLGLNIVSIRPPRT
jgi:ribonuclease VapC